MFVSCSDFRPSLLLAGKAKGLTLEVESRRNSTQVGYGLTCKYYTRIGVTASNKRSSLQQCGSNNSLKSFIVQALAVWGIGSPANNLGKGIELEHAFPYCPG